MKITIFQDEIEKSIKNYIEQSIRMTNKDIRIELAATRGDKGFTCEITLTDKEETPVEVHKEEKKSAFAQSEVPVELNKPIDTTEESTIEAPKKKSFFSDITL